MNSVLKRFDDQISVITGSAAGLGYCIAKAFAKEGSKIVISDIADSSSIDRVRKEIESLGVECLGIRIDVKKLKEVEKLFEETVKRFGKVDILVNNAGGSLQMPIWIEDVDEAAWDLVMDTNLKGTFFCTKVAVRHMIPRKTGKIVNLASLAGKTGGSVMNPQTSGPQYGSSKGGVIAFTKQMAKELGPHGIRVNAVAPGIFLSGARVREMWEKLSAAEKNDKLKMIPLGRLPEPEEVASVVVWLSSDESSYVTGVTIDVNGGQYMA